MGYYSYFSLDTVENITVKQAKEIAIAIHKKLIGESGYYEWWYEKVINIKDTDWYDPTDIINYPFTDEMKWYENVEDMEDISKQFPDIMFVLTRNGEEREDNVRHYIKNGIAVEYRGTIVYNDDYWRDDWKWKAENDNSVKE